MMPSLTAARARREYRIYYPPRLKPFVRALISLYVSLTCLMALTSDEADRAQEITWLLGAAFVFFGAVSAVIVFRLRKKRPVLVLGADGLMVRHGSTRPQHMNWDDITDLRRFRTPYSHKMVIDYRLPRRGPAVPGRRMPLWRGVTGHGRIVSATIPADAISARLKKVEAEIRRRLG